LEGMANENIIATGIYYYSIENITTSRLTFRTSFDVSVFKHAQSEHEGLEKVYGFENYEDLPVQWAGEVEAREGLFVVFPNFAQHQVQPFELADPTRPGHRKILCFFLVDPDVPVISTEVVPQQNQVLFMRELDSALGGRMPDLCVALITDFLGCTFTEQEAAEIAHQVMEERSHPAEGGFAFTTKINLW